MLKKVKTPEEMLEMYYLEARCHLLETAAMIDRLHRYDSEQKYRTNPKFRKLEKALQILADEQGEKTERFLEAFSEEVPS